VVSVKCSVEIHSHTNNVRTQVCMHIHLYYIKARKKRNTGAPNICVSVSLRKKYRC